MKDRRTSLDSRLLALLTAFFSLLCAGTLWLELGSSHDGVVAVSRA